MALFCRACLLDRCHSDSSYRLALPFAPGPTINALGDTLAAVASDRGSDRRVRICGVAGSPQCRRSARPQPATFATPGHAQPRPPATTIGRDDHAGRTPTTNQNDPTGPPFTKKTSRRTAIVKRAEVVYASSTYTSLFFAPERARTKSAFSKKMGVEKNGGGKISSVFWAKLPICPPHTPKPVQQENGFQGTSISGVPLGYSTLDQVDSAFPEAFPSPRKN